MYSNNYMIDIDLSPTPSPEVVTPYKSNIREPYEKQQTISQN